MFEASMNFDGANVEPFLRHLEDELQLGLPIENLIEFAQRVAVEAEHGTTMEVDYGGERLKLEFRVFMDDEDAPDLYFLTPSEELSKAIGARMAAFAEERGL
jgi:hypothetical protein